MSLTETCIAVAAVTTVMAISVPSLSRSREIYVLQSSARTVASKMYSARVTAITRNQDCRLVVTSPSAYVTECQGTAWQVVDRVTLPKGITIAANARPEFHPRGNVSPTATLTLSNSRRSIRVIVNVNGRVRLQ